jgi:soluble lytic murein transglycosylase
MQEALDQAERLWLVDFSQPDECDSIFNVWKASGSLSPEIAWQRYSLVIQANKTDLARYLIRFLSREDKKFASSYLQVHRRPTNIKQFDKFKSQDSKTREIVLHGVRRLSRSEPVEALDTLVKYESMHTFEADHLTETYVYIGKKLATSLDPNNQIEGLPLNLQDYPDLTEARIRMALRKGDQSQVLALISLLPAETREQSGWQYWQARALIGSSDPADRDSGSSIFNELAESRTFHGFLSADRLQKDYNFDDQPSDVTTEEILALEQTPGIQRALELLTINERNRARREWSFTTRAFSSWEKKIAARVARKWGWYKPAIQALIEAKAWNDLEYRFPIAYPDEFIRNARVADIPVFWSFAIARQESAFMPDAKSSMGAYGLMQLMPNTAKRMARRTGVSFKYNRELIDPSLNIKLGSEYLGRMLRRYENNRIFASAAYNAGPSNVDRWINPELPLDVWIETIPFTETRNYVQNILMFSAIYGRLLKQNQPFIYRHEFEDFFSPLRLAPLNNSPTIDSPAIDSPAINSPTINSPAINSPAIDNQPINPQEIDTLAPVMQSGIENTNASE